METYGKVIPGLMIDGKPAPYGVVNEREIRATAGIMFLIGICTFGYVFFTKDFRPMYFVVPIYFIDFFLKTVFDPSYSIFGYIGGILVARQRPEYVGAIQKRFAWSIGLILATIMMIFAVGFGVRGWLPFSICLICLFFMWMESSLGICVGCKIYWALVRRKIMPQPEHAPACPGGICSIEKNCAQQK